MNEREDMPLRSLRRLVRRGGRRLEQRPKRSTRPPCGARCRSKGGAPCAAPVAVRRNAMTGEVIVAKRCRMHGGLSTGPRTWEGRQRCREAGRRGAEERWRRYREAREWWVVRRVVPSAKTRQQRVCAARGLFASACLLFGAPIARGGRAVRAAVALRYEAPSRAQVARLATARTWSCTLAPSRPFFWRWAATILAALRPAYEPAAHDNRENRYRSPRDGRRRPPHDSTVALRSKGVRERGVALCHVDAFLDGGNKGESEREVTSHGSLPARVERTGRHGHNGEGTRVTDGAHHTRNTRRVDRPRCGSAYREHGAVGRKRPKRDGQVARHSARSLLDGGVSSPAAIQAVAASDRQTAESILSGAIIPDHAPVYVLKVRGGPFTSQRKPPGVAAAPQRAFLTITVDAATKRLTDTGYDDAEPDLTQIGSPVVDLTAP